MVYLKCCVILLLTSRISCDSETEDTIIVERSDHGDYSNIHYEDSDLDNFVGRDKKGKDLYVIPISFSSYYVFPNVFYPPPLVWNQTLSPETNLSEADVPNGGNETASAQFRQGLAPNNPACFLIFPGGTGRCVNRHNCRAPPGINWGAIVNVCSYVGATGLTDLGGICCSELNIVGPLYPEASVSGPVPIPLPIPVTSRPIIPIPESTSTLPGPRPPPPPPGTSSDQVSLNGPECGVRAIESEKILGGETASLGESPWMALLFRGVKHYCGGSLIDDVHVLTAAHCIIRYTSSTLRELTVRVGEHNVVDATETPTQERKVTKIARHKKFSPSLLTYDIAILTLDKPVVFGPTVRSICLAEESDKYVGKRATVAGWGGLNEKGPLPQVLQKVDVDIWRNSDCETSYGNAAPGGILSHMMCASGKDKDSCTGDSGGPLVRSEDGYKFEQIGIVSWGIGCGLPKYPGVYTRVNYFINWIKKNLK